MTAQESPESVSESVSDQASDAAETLSSPVQTSGEDYQELNNRYLRLAADFDNFRKRQAQEREFLFKYGAQNTLEALLPVLDNLERAQQSLSESSDPKMLFKSFDMLATQLLESLKAVGLQKLESVGESFDPERHEAVSQQDTTDFPDQAVMQVYQAGYQLHDRVIRPAKVVVAVNASGDTISPEDDPVFAKPDANPFSN